MDDFIDQAAAVALASAATAGVMWKDYHVRRKKRCGRLRGESRPRANPVGDGEGWGRDRGRVVSLLPSAGGGGGKRRARVAERDPKVRIGLRLALDVAVAGLRPEPDLFVLIA